MISCGSSAGNFFYNCDNSGCHGMEQNSTNQQIADQMCADYEQNGCPGGLFGDGGDDWIGGIIGE